MPYSQRRGRTQPGLEKRLGPGLQWIYSPRGMCLACPGSGQRRGRGQERCGPEWRTGRIMHQAETVPGQGGVKPGDNLSPCRTLPGRKEGPGQGDAWVLPAGEGCLRTRLFKDSLVVGAPGREGTCGVTEDRCGGGVPPVSVTGAWSWGWWGGRWEAQIPGYPGTRYQGGCLPELCLLPPSGHGPPGSAAARQDRSQGARPLVLHGRTPQNRIVRAVGERPRAVLSAQGWGNPCPLLRAEPTGSTEPIRGPQALPPPVRPERLGASPCCLWEGQAPALSGAIGAGHRRCLQIQTAGAAFTGSARAPLPKSGYLWPDDQRPSEV